VGTNIKLARKV